MSRTTQLKLQQLKVIIISWLIIGFLIAIYDYLILLTSSSVNSSEEFPFWFSVGVNVGAALMGALLGGSFLVFFINVSYQDKPYGYTIIAVSISFILIIALIAVILGIILAPSFTMDFVL